MLLLMLNSNLCSPLDLGGQDCVPCPKGLCSSLSVLVRLCFHVLIPHCGMSQISLDVILDF